MSRWRSTDSVGSLAGWSFRSTSRVSRSLAGSRVRFGVPAFAIEGTGSYGASLARTLLADDFAVFECERPQRRRRKDKNDLIDAGQAARRLLSGQPLPLPRTGIERERVRLLLLERRSAHQARQQALNQLKAAIVTLDPPQRARLRSLPAGGARAQIGQTATAGAAAAARATGRAARTGAQRD